MFRVAFRVAQGVKIASGVKNMFRKRSNQNIEKPSKISTSAAKLIFWAFLDFD